jgi:hypothetical protein
LLGYSETDWDRTVQEWHKKHGRDQIKEPQKEGDEKEEERTERKHERVKKTTLKDGAKDKKTLKEKRK